MWISNARDVIIAQLNSCSLVKKKEKKKRPTKKKEKSWRLGRKAGDMLYPETV